MRKTVYFCLIGLVALVFNVSTRAVAGECSGAVKAALANANWSMTVRFNRGRTEEFSLKTRVTADGAMEVVGRGSNTMKVTCDGDTIAFDWKNQEDKRFRLTLGKDGVFTGSRTSANGKDYPATLTKN